MPKKYTKMAIAYDFDGTLAPGNMQEHSFIPALGTSAEKFWKQAKKIAKDNDMDEILAYMQLMLKEANLKGISTTKNDFKNHGKTIALFDGVETWFGRINQYAKSKNIQIEHYIISSGLREILEGTKIHKEFKCVFASGYKYDQNNVPEYPALVVNYTTKTQYLFRINKGIHNAWDNTKINKFTKESERPVPFKNMIFIGDGETDIPAMKMTNYQGGHSIAVYIKNKKKGNSHANAQKLVNDGRATLCAEADYSENNNLDKAVKAIIDKIAADRILKLI